MDTTQIAENTVRLTTNIPEGRTVKGLMYGAHVQRNGSAGYYVRLAKGSRQWCVAWMTPENCGTDRQITVAIRNELAELVGSKCGLRASCRN